MIHRQLMAATDRIALTFRLANAVGDIIVIIEIFIERLL